MAKLGRIPTLVYIIIVVAAVLASLSIGGALWIEAAENLRLKEGGEADMQVGLAYALFAGFVPVMIILAASITSAIMLAKRVRARQDTGLAPAGWATRAGNTLGLLIVLLAVAGLIVWLVWFLIHILLVQAYGSDVVGEAGMSGTFPTILGLIYGPGMTGGLPAALFTASAPTEEEENA